ncbi:MAG: hypothetical protein IPL75_03235 [Acidobacteria bacterium]|nr:hypothetical protein [Acidobacteriota bacterium]
MKPPVEWSDHLAVEDCIVGPSDVQLAVGIVHAIESGTADIVVVTEGPKASNAFSDLDGCRAVSCGAPETAESPGPDLE